MLKCIVNLVDLKIIKKYASDILFCSSHRIKYNGENRI